MVLACAHQHVPAAPIAGPDMWNVCAGGADDNAVVMVICKKQEWLVDLMIEPGRLLPLRPDVTPQTSTLFRVSGAASEMLNGRRSAEGMTAEH